LLPGGSTTQPNMMGRVKNRLNNSEKSGDGTKPPSPGKSTPKAAAEPEPAAKAPAAPAAGSRSAAAPAVPPAAARQPTQPSIDEGCPSTFEVGGGANAPPSAKTDPVPSAKLDRTRFSVASLETNSELDVLELQIKAMQVTSDEAETVLSAEVGTVEIPTRMRNELAQLHGNLNKLLATRLDAILTGELNTGKDAARAKRKELIKTTETLIERVEGQVKRYDQHKSAG